MLSIHRQEEVKLQSLYKNIGGSSFISNAFDQFYTRILNDKRISHYFEHMERQRLKRMKAEGKAYFAHKMGAFPGYKGNFSQISQEFFSIIENDMRNEDVDILCHHLYATLIKDLRLPHHISSEIMSLLQKTREEVLHLP